MGNRSIVCKKRNLVIAMLLVAVLALAGVFSTTFAMSNPQLANVSEAKKMIAFYDFKDDEGGLDGFEDSMGLNRTSLKGMTSKDGTIQANNGAKSNFATSAAAGATDRSYFHWEQSGLVTGGGGFTLNVNGALPTYTIGLKFSLSKADKANRYIRIMDFTDRASDNGFYFNYGGLELFPYGAKAFGAENGKVVDLIISRDGDTNKFLVYAIKDGAVPTLVYSLSDTSGSTIPKYDGSKTIFHLFNDGTGSEFSPSGDIYAVKLWDSMLSENEMIESLKPTVVFVANGGEGNIGDQSNESGTIANLTANTFSRDNCTFMGWNTKPDGTGFGYADGAEYDFTEYITLYAMWKVNTVNEEKALCVSQNGDDTTGSGTLQKPYRTIGKAYEEAKNSDTIYIIGNIEPSSKIIMDTKSVKIRGLIGNEIISRAGESIARNEPLFSLTGGSLCLENITVNGGADWGENGVNIGKIPQGKIIEVKDSGELTLGIATTLRDSAAGAVSGTGNAQITQNGATIKDCSSAIGAGIALDDNAVFTMNSGTIIGCRAIRNGGGIYSVGSSQVVLKRGEISNNSTKSSGGITAQNVLEIDPNAVTVTDEIAWVGSAEKSIKLLSAPTSDTGIFTIRCNTTPADGATIRVIDGMDESDDYKGSKLKPHFKMANAGYTFEYSRDDMVLDDGTALYISATKTPVAAKLDLDGRLIKSYLTLQAAIKDSLNGEILYVLTDNLDSLIKVYETVNIVDGKNIILKSGKATPTSDGLTDFTYEINASGSPVTLMRGENFTSEMFLVEAGGSLTLENIILNGGAVWGGDKIAITGVENTYYVKTNNTGVKANAPILAVQGELTLKNHAALKNNENSFSVFGSENYGGAVRVFGINAAFTMETGSVISNCYAREGGAVMNVTKLKNVDGSAVGSKFIMKGGTITGCVSQSKGSAVQTIYGNAATEINGGVITGLNPYETNYGVMTVEEGGSLKISGGTITNTVTENAAIYVYNQYINKYSGYLEGLHAAEFKLLGGSIVGKIGLDASGMAKTTGEHSEHDSGSPKEFLIFIDTVVAETSTYSEENYAVSLIGSWRVGDKIINGSGATFEVGGLASNQFEFTADSNIVVGGMEINQAHVNLNGTVTVIGKIVGDKQFLTVTVGGVETRIEVTGNTFTADTNGSVDAGKKEVKAVYAGGGNKSVTSQMLITVPKRDRNNILTGEIDYGTLDSGDELQYKSTDGSYKTYRGTDLPNDIYIDSNGFADFKLIEAGGIEYDYRAYVGERVTSTQPGDDVLIVSDVTKTHNSITIETKEGYEYRLVNEQGNIVALDGNDWNIGVDGTLTYVGLNPDVTYTVEVRVPGTAENQPGKIAAVAVTTKTEVEQGQDEAKTALDTAAQAAKDAINANENLSAEEKATKVAAVDNALASAKTAIDSATTLNEVEAKQGEGETAIGSVKTEADELAVTNLATAKNTAKTALDTAAQAVKDSINANANLSAAEKAEKLAVVDTALGNAKTAIDSATTLNEVEAKQGEGETVIGSIKTEADELGEENLATAKNTAKTALDEAAQAAKDYINKNANLSVAEKAAKVAAVDTALGNAKTAIDSAETIADVATKKGEGETAIGSIKTEADELGVSNLATTRKKVSDEFNKFVADNCKDSKYTADDLAILKNKIADAKDKIGAITNIAGLEKWLADSITDVKTVKEKAPIAEVDKENDCVENLAPGEYQVIAGGKTYNFTVGEDGKLLLQGKDNGGNDYDFADQNIRLIKKGENGFADSYEQTIALPMRVVKPENVPIDGIIVAEKSITIKGEAVVAGNKYAVVDNDGNIVSSGWTVGANGADIFFGGLESGKEYRVVVIGKNSDEPDKLPSNPSNGTTINTNVANENNNYIWVILCSILGVLLIIECLYIFVFRKKKNNENDEHTADGGKSNPDVKMNSSILSILAMLAPSVIIPVAGPIMLGCIAAAMVAVPITVHLLEKKKKIEPKEAKLEESVSLQVTSNDCEANSENAIVTVIVNTKNQNTEKTSEQHMFEENQNAESKADSLQVTSNDCEANSENAIVPVVANTKNQNTEKTLEQHMFEENQNAESKAEEAEITISEVLAKELALEKKSKSPNETRVNALKDLLAEHIEKEQREEKKYVLLKELKTEALNRAETNNTTIRTELEVSKSKETDELKKEVFTMLILDAESEEADLALMQEPESEGQSKDDNDLLIDEKVRERLIEIENARQAYLVAKKNGLVAVPVFSFRLSREDVLDHVGQMAQNKVSFPVETAAKLRLKPSLPDSLYCGEWCFGLMYEKQNIVKLVLRLNDIEVLELAKIHPSICKAKFPGGANWNTVVVDCSYTSKKEVYEIIDLAYRFVLKKYYELKDKAYITNVEKAKQDTAQTEKDVKQNEKTADPVFDSAIQEYAVAVSNFNKKYKLSFTISRRNILNYTSKVHKENAEIVEREKWYLPASLKVNGKTYAMIYEKNEKVRMTLKLADDYAESLTAVHNEVCRARFPKGHNWYAVVIDGSFYSKKEIYIILKASQKFIEERKN